jgi:integrase
VALIRDPYAIEAAIKGNDAATRLVARQERAAPILARLDDWLRHHRARASAKSPLGEALAYITKYRDGLGRLLTDGRIEIDNNTVERTIRPIAKMFNLAEDWGLRSDGTNPARRIQKYRKEEKKRYLSDAEQARLGTVLADALESGQETEYAVSAIYFLMLTGCRLGEILTLRWDYITTHHLELPDSKTGRRRIPLPREAYEVITALPRRNGNPYVILGETEHGHLVNLQKTWLRVRKAAKLEDVRMHDLRHTYASVAVMSGIDPFLLKEIMGHRNLQTTLRYAHFVDESVQRAAGSVASRLAGAMRRPARAVHGLRVVS